MMFGRRRLGLGIGRDRVSAVLIVGRAVRWAAHSPRHPETALADAIAALLTDCPRRSMLRLTATAAVGPTVSQLKCLTDVPPVPDAKAIVALVRENSGRFFLRNGVPLLISGAHVESPSRIWVAAVDGPVVAEVAAGCRRAGIRLRSVVPSAVSLRHAIRGKSITWLDGDVRLDIAFGDKSPFSVRRMPANGVCSETPPPVSALANLGHDALGSTDAIGAALTPRDEAISVRVDEAPRVASPRRLTHAAIACFSACVLALASPGVIASLAARNDRAGEARIEASVRAARSDANELARTTAEMRSLADFADARRSMVLLLTEITRALPDSATLVALQVDSGGSGSVVALAPHAAAVVDAVERTPGLASPQILGPVTRESVGGRTMERVAVRFRVLAGTTP